MELFISLTAVIVAGLAGILGVWMEREPEAPPKWAIVFSTLILFAATIELGHSYNQNLKDTKIEDSMATLLVQLSELSESSNNPALNSFVSSELALQARSNPEVMKKVEVKVEESGGDVEAIRTRAVTGSRQIARPNRKVSGKKRKKGKAGASGKKRGKSAGKGKGKGKGKSAGKSSGKATTPSDKRGERSSSGSSSGKGKSGSSGSSSSGGKKKK